MQHAGWHSAAETSDLLPTSNERKPGRQFATESVLALFEEAQNLILASPASFAMRQTLGPAPGGAKGRLQEAFSFEPHRVTEGDGWPRGTHDVLIARLL